MTFQPGHKLATGRPKGTPNKLPAMVRDSLIQTFEKLGGIEAFFQWAKKNPDIFYPLWTKLVPQSLMIGNLDDKPFEISELSPQEAARRLALVFAKASAETDEKVINITPDAQAS